MTDINFYVSKTEGLDHRIAIAYRLAQRALQHKFKIYIHTDSEFTSKKVDNYFWNHEPASFIPHSIVDMNSVAPTQELIKQKDDKDISLEINISHEFEPLLQCDYLINLSNQQPNFFSRFLKVAEILDNNQEIIAAGRKRYSFYRDRGYNLAYHQL